MLLFVWVTVVAAAAGAVGMVLLVAVELVAARRDRNEQLAGDRDVGDDDSGDGGQTPPEEAESPDGAPVDGTPLIADGEASDGEEAARSGSGTGHGGVPGKGPGDFRDR